jgi:hypothetical protein
MEKPPLPPPHISDVKTDSPQAKAAIAYATAVLETTAGGLRVAARTYGAGKCEPDELYCMAVRFASALNEMAMLDYAHRAAAQNLLDPYQAYLSRRGLITVIPDYDRWFEKNTDELAMKFELEDRKAEKDGN